MKPASKNEKCFAESNKLPLWPFPPRTWTIAVASPAMKYSLSRSNRLHSSSTVKDLNPQLLQPPAGWGERAQESEGQKARGRSRERPMKERERAKWRRGTERDRLHPPVPLSHWPKACKATPATDDITVWNTAGEGWASPASRHPGNRSTRCASPLAMSLSPILFCESFVLISSSSSIFLSRLFYVPLHFIP